MTVNDHAPVAQVFIERDLENAQALGNLIHAQVLFAVKRLGHDGRALGFFR